LQIFIDKTLLDPLVFDGLLISGATPTQNFIEQLEVERGLIMEQMSQ
jgi:hypothetical protein